MWEEKTIEKQGRGLQNQALHAFGPHRVSHQVLERCCSYFEPVRAHFVAIWPPPEPSWARPGGAKGLFDISWVPRGCRRARLQVEPPHFDPLWAPKSANLTPKGGPNELQNCSKKSSEIWLVTEIDFESFLEQFLGHVGGENNEKAWEGSSKSSFADL